MPDLLKNIGPTELVILFAILVLFFGSKIAIGIGKAGGQTVREIKKIKNEILGDSEVKNKHDENNS